MPSGSWIKFLDDADADTIGVYYRFVPRNPGDGEVPGSEASRLFSVDLCIACEAGKGHPPPILPSDHRWAIAVENLDYQGPPPAPKPTIEERWAKNSLAMTIAIYHVMLDGITLGEFRERKWAELFAAAVARAGRK